MSFRSGAGVLLVLLFPPGIISDSYSYRGSGGTQMSGYHGKILPFIEQKPTYDLLGVGTRRAPEAIDDWANTSAAFQNPIALFRCPTDIGPETNTGTSRVGGVTDTTERQTIVSNYPGVNRGGRSQAYEVVQTSDVTERRIGTFIVNSAIRIAHITDGTSNTAVIGERCWEYRVGTALRQAKAGNALVVRGTTDTQFDCGG